MRFNPKEKKQGLFAEGEYEFIVVDAEEKLSGNGNLMIEIEVEVSDEKGSTRKVKDYLLAKRQKKLKSAAVACGIGDKFETGSLTDADFVDRRGRLRLKIESDKKGEYPDKNVVDEYLPKNQVKALSSGGLESVLSKYVSKEAL